MIARTVFLLGATGIAYALLRGWPAEVPGVMRACFAVLAWVAGIGVWSKRRVPENVPTARARLRPRWPDFLVIGMAILALEGGLLWLLGAAPQPLEAAGLAIERHFRPKAAAMRALQVAEADASPGHWLWDQQTRRPLPKRTDFKPGTKPEVFVRLTDPADAAALLKDRVYVRAFALGRYENAGWSPLAGDAHELTADDSGFVKLAPERRVRSIPHEVFHSVDSGGQNALTALQGVTEAAVSPLRRIDDGLILLPPVTTAGGYQYRARSSPMRLEDLPDGGGVSAWPGAAAALTAPLEPVEFASRLRELALSAAGAGTVKEQLFRLRDYLRTAYSYSLATSNPRDLDPMENFLFQEKRGHCEYFATAGALMARELGLPSRVAYGWAGGTWFEAAGLFVFRANEAHAWTEIRLDPFGWVIMDPTPLSAGGSTAAQVAPPDEPLPGAQVEATTQDPPAAGPGPGLPQLGMGLMLGCGLPALLIAVRRSRCWVPPEQVFSAGSIGPPAPRYLEAWRRACAGQGLPLPPGHTLRRQISQLREPPEFAAEMVAYHYATRYEGRPPDPQLERQLTRRIRAWGADFSGIKPGGSPQTHVT